MTAVTGPTFYSTDLQTTTPVDIDTMIFSLEPKDTPLFTGVGADGVPLLGRGPCANTVFYWMEERAPVPRGTLNEDLDDSETGVDVSTGHGVRFPVGCTIRIDDEFMKVTAISTDTLTVTRGVIGSSATTHTSGAEVIGVGTILAEGDIGSSNFQDRDSYYNYTQVWSAKIQVSRTEQQIRKYGIPNELARQIMKRQQSFTQEMEQAALYGIRYQSGRTRSTGGLAYYQTNTDSSTAWITVTDVEDKLQIVYDLGGSFSHIMARPAAFNALNNTAGTERIQSVTIDDARRGRRQAQTVETAFGTVNLARNRWVRTTQAFGYNPSDFTFNAMTPMTVTPLAKTDDTDSWMLVCEGGFSVKGAAFQYQWTGLNTSAGLPTGLV